MKLPKKGERGFTLIELLIVVAILGVLAAVVIPNVQRFIGAGREEAKDTELATIQAAVSAMMVDNEIATLPAGTFPIDEANAINDMGAFPSDAACATVGEKVTDPEGHDYVTVTDKDGYFLYGHDISGSEVGNPNLDQVNVNYVAQEYTAYFYWVNASGTVFQGGEAPPAP